MQVLTSDYAVTSKVVSTDGFALHRLQGYANGATDKWLQLHDAAVLPTNGTVPKKSFYLPATAQFHWDFSTLPILFTTGLVVAVSDTQATLTTSASTMDLTAEGFQAFDTTGTTIGGDFTTGDDELQVWADASGPKRLRKLEVTLLNSLTVVQYAQIFAHNTPQDGDVPLLSVALPFTAAGQGVELFFGENFVPFSKAAGVERDGLTVSISTTRNTRTISTNADYAIRATYK